MQVVLLDAARQGGLLASGLESGVLEGALQLLHGVVLAATTGDGSGDRVRHCLM